MGIKAYEGESGRSLAARYESISPDHVFATIVDLFPSPPGTILDVGAGSGRDAAWLARKGYTVLAVDPSETMRKEGQERHKEAQVQWLNDSLPELKEVYRVGPSFDAIFVSAVWMHVLPSKRKRAFRKLVGLLKSGGKLFISLRLGPVDQQRSMFPVSPEEITSLAQTNGMAVVYHGNRQDVWGRSGLSWGQMVLHHQVE